MRSICGVGFGLIFFACSAGAPSTSDAVTSLTPDATDDGGTSAFDGGTTSTNNQNSTSSDAGSPTESGARGASEGGTTSTQSAAGFLHTSGAHIVDAAGNTVRLSGVSWFGLETNTYAPHGLWARSMSSMLDQMKTLGFNVIRLPYSSQLFDQGSTPNGFDTNLNPDLVGLTGIQIIDKVVAGAKARGIRVLLDRHRPDSGAQSPLWYTDQYSEQRWISDWTMLATRYASEPTVIGADLHNEPHAQATWGDNSLSTDFRLAAERCGNAILAVNPNWLIVVEGIEAVSNNYYWWGGNLAAAGANPVQLNVSNRVVYSPHDYPPSVYEQTWFSDPTFPANMPGLWDRTWGYLAEEGTAPILIGEFGTELATTPDAQWLSTLVTYIGAHDLSFTFWSWNPDSGDTGGILADDWQTVNTNKMNAIKSVLAPPAQ